MKHINVHVCPKCGYIPKRSEQASAENCIHCMMPLIPTDIPLKSYYKYDNEKLKKIKHRIRELFVFSSEYYERSSKTNQTASQEEIIPSLLFVSYDKDHFHHHLYDTHTTDTDYTEE